MLLTGKKGFTLLEVLIVLIIMGVVTGFLLPNFDTIHRSIQLNLRERKLINLFRQARKQAITANKPQKIEVRGTSFLYQPSDAEFVEFNQGIVKIELIENSEDIIIFYPDGTSSGAELIIHLENEQKLKFKIDTISGNLKAGENL